MTLLLAVVTLSWLAVTRDCRGGLESVPPVYEVWTYRAEVSGSYVGPDGSPWPLYARVESRDLTLDTEMALTDPQPGGVLAYGDPVAIDVSGNRSDGCAP